ncbi:hypothetical protein BH09VER1_BH09VER1_28070 [soil metagenome]
MRSALLTSLFLAALSLPLLGGTLLPYAPTPESVPSQDYTVTVDGQPIPVERLGAISYARFQFTGQVQVAIRASHPIAHSTISPVSYQIPATTTGDTLSFPLTQPRSLIISVDALDQLLLFADSPETDAPASSGPGIINLATYLPPHRPLDTPVTAAFQKALDDTSALHHGAGGTLYVPPGLYLTGQLTLRSHVHLYLPAGVLLRSVAPFTPQNFPRQGTNPVDSSFLFISDATGASLTGRGVIDGNGLAVRQGDPTANVKLLRAVRSSALRISGLYFRNSSRWSLHLLHSDDVTLQDIKLINDTRGQPTPQGFRKFLVTNTDGLDIDASSHVTLRDSFIYTGDDATTIKVTGYLHLQRPCDHITIQHNVLWSYKCGIRIGDETRDDLHDITFRDNDIVHSDRAIAIYSRDGGRLFNLNLLNNRTEYVGGDSSQRLFLLRVETLPKGPPPGPIQHVLIRDFFALQPAPQPSTIAGLDPTAQVTDITFENIVISGTRAQSLHDIPLDLKNFTDRILLH